MIADINQPLISPFRKR